MNLFYYILIDNVGNKNDFSNTTQNIISNKNSSNYNTKGNNRYGGARRGRGRQVILLNLFQNYFRIFNQIKMKDNQNKGIFIIYFIINLEMDVVVQRIDKMIHLKM